MSRTRVLYQSFGQQEGMNTYRQVLHRLIETSAGPTSDVVLGSLPTALLEGKGYGSAEALDVPLLLRSIDRQVSDGVDVVAIGNGFDPGLWEARELFRVPIVGWLETMLAYSMRVGYRVGVLCSGTSGPSRIEELMIKYGVRSRCVPPVSLGTTMKRILPAFEDATVLEATRAVADDACARLADRGAEVVFIASGMLDAAIEISGADTLGGLPFLPGIPILMKEAEAAAELARAGVPFVSRIGRFGTPPQSVADAVANRANP